MPLCHPFSLSLRSSHPLSLVLSFPLSFCPPFFLSRNFSLPLIKIDTSLDLPTFLDSPFFKHIHTHTCTLHLDTVRGRVSVGQVGARTTQWSKDHKEWKEETERWEKLLITVNKGADRPMSCFHRDIIDRGDMPAWSLSARARETLNFGLGCLSLTPRLARYA